MTSKNRNTIYLGLKFGLLITVPMIGFLLLGLWVDRTLETFPIYLIVGGLVGIFSAFLIVYKGIIPYLNKKFINNNKDNK